MAECIVYRGCHSLKFQTIFEQTFNNEDHFLLVCPPRHSFSEIKNLVEEMPFGKIRLVDETDNKEDTFTNLKNRSSWGESFKFKIGLFTSGTSGGEKKIALYTQKNLQASSEAIFKLFKETNNIFCYPQPYHIFGLSLGYMHTFLQNKNLIVPEGRYGKTAHGLWLGSAAKYPDLLTLGTPTHFKDLINETENLDNVPSTYSCILGGARVDKNLWLDARDKLKISKPSIGYGCTEASPGLFHLAPGDEPLGDGDIGEPLDGVELSFKDNGTFSFTGENLSRAWIDNKGLHYCDELDVPDLLKKTDSGKYICTGRLQEVINRGGEKFFPEELETYFLSEHNLNVLCLKKPCERLGEDILLLIEGEKEERILKNIKDSFSNKFKRGLSLENIAFMKTFPLNDSQKIDRLKCLSLLQKKN